MKQYLPGFKNITLIISALVLPSCLLAENIIQIAPEQMALESVKASAGKDLTISSESGEQFYYHFNAQQEITFDKPGKDGIYTWEIVYIPIISSNTRQLMQNVDSKDRAALARSLQQQGLLPRSNDQKSSGTFKINKGKLINPLIQESVENKTKEKTKGPDYNKDQVIADDLIAQFSLCVGSDCTNGENFSFDTIRMKENNLKINFDDTSASASFPANDWRISANDTSNGGASYLSIEDATAGTTPFKVSAGSGNNALSINSSGNVGLNKASAATQLQVTDGNSPAFRLEQDGSSGFGAQTWDVSGNEANFFIRDVTNGSKLPFKIIPGASTNSLVIASNNSIGLGTGTNPDATLHINSVNSENFLIRADGTIDQALTLTNDGDMTIQGALNELSSKSSKEHFLSINPAKLLSAIANLSISTWNYKHQSDDNRHIGPMAEEFYAAFGFGTSDKKVRTGDVASVALAAVQALQQELAKKDQQIKSLEQRLSALEAKQAQ
ncbi:MAG: tail fiber domain-containing protein [bacterium]